MNSTINSKKIEFSKKLLGPIFYDFCAQLHLYLDNNIVNKSDDCMVLYMARAGLRLRYLYQLYREINNLSPICVEKDLYISRLSCAKGCISTNFDYIAPIIVKPYINNNIFDLFKGITDYNLVLDQEWANIKTSEKTFIQFYWDDSHNSKLIRNHFIDQSKLFKTYIKKITENHKNIFLVDSGWTGKTQAMLMQSFPDINWNGLYFGKWAYGKNYPEHFSSIVGLCLDDSIHYEGHPKASIFRYHHLIEDPLEINFPSVKEYYYNQKVDDILPDSDIASESVIEPSEVDTHFRGIVEYFQSRQEFKIEQISQDAELAYKKLNKLIRFPRKSDLSMMTVRDRSTDFGKDESNSILIQPSKSCLREKRRRIRRALWKEGQVALEFPTPIAWIIQRVVKFAPAV